GRCTSGDEHLACPVLACDPPENVSDLVVGVQTDADDSIPSQIANLKLLLRLCVGVGATPVEVFEFHPLQQAVVVSSVLPEEDPDTAQDVVEVGVGEAEAKEEERL